MYLSDLRALEAAGLVRPGTVLVADNVIFPGAPDYLAYVRQSPHYTSRFVPGKLEYQTAIEDGVEISECRSLPNAQ